MGCGGVYASEDETIVAVGPEREAQLPCGTLLAVCGPGGCVLAVRQDGCPGCGPGVFDLSEAGLARVCGPGSGVCRALLQPLQRRLGLELDLLYSGRSEALTASSEGEPWEASRLLDRE
jgi:hypothetical protein